MPYHPLLYAALFRLSNTTHYLLVGRIFSSLCDVLVVVCIVGVYRRIFDSFPISAMLLGLTSAVLYLFNPFVIYANGYAWNNDVVVLCVMLSFWLFIAIDFKQKSKYWRIALIGALLTFTTCMRITMALVQLLFFVVLLSRPAESMKQRFKNILPFVIAAAVVLIWPVWVIAQAPRAFFLNLFQISMLNSRWVHQTGMFYKKFDILFTSLRTPAYLVLIFIAVYLCVICLAASQTNNITRHESIDCCLAGFCLFCNRFNHARNLAATPCYAGPFHNHQLCLPASVLEKT
jgi:4-amino-4-deoxy-L-arabinose transferase-like glycosyltransferase